MGSRMEVISQCEHNLDLLHLHQNSWVTRCIVNEQSCFEGDLFSEQYVSTVGLKYSVNHFVNRCMCCHQALLFRFWSIGRVDLASFLRVPGFSLQPPDVLTPKRVSLSFEALKLGIDFSSLAMKSPRWLLV